MADDINKTISVDIQVNTAGLQQIDQYKTSFDNLRTSINGLGKPLTDMTTSINGLGKPLADMAANIGSTSKPLADMATNIGNVVKGLTKADSSLNDFATKTVSVTDTTAKKQVAIVQDAEGKKSKTILGSAIQTAAKLLGITRITANKTATITTAEIAARQKSEIDSVQKTSDAAFTIITKGIEQQGDAKVRGLETQRKAIDNNAAMR